MPAPRVPSSRGDTNHHNDSNSNSTNAIHPDLRARIPPIAPDQEQSERCVHWGPVFYKICDEGRRIARVPHGAVPTSRHCVPEYPYVATMPDVPLKGILLNGTAQASSSSSRSDSLNCDTHSPAKPHRPHNTNHSTEKKKNQYDYDDDTPDSDPDSDPAFLSPETNHLITFIAQAMSDKMRFDLQYCAQNLASFFPKDNVPKRQRDRAENETLTGLDRLLRPRSGITHLEGFAREIRVDVSGLVARFLAEDWVDEKEDEESGKEEEEGDGDGEEGEGNEEEEEEHENVEEEEEEEHENEEENGEEEDENEEENVEGEGTNGETGHETGGDGGDGNHQIPVIKIQRTCSSSDISIDDENESAIIDDDDDENNEDNTYTDPETAIPSTTTTTQPTTTTTSNTTTSTSPTSPSPSTLSISLSALHPSHRPKLIQTPTYRPVHRFMTSLLPFRDFAPCHHKPTTLHEASPISPSLIPGDILPISCDWFPDHPVLKIPNKLFIRTLESAFRNTLKDTLSAARGGVLVKMLARAKRLHIERRRARARVIAAGRRVSSSGSGTRTTSTDSRTWTVASNDSRMPTGAAFAMDGAASSHLSSNTGSPRGSVRTSATGSSGTHDVTFGVADVCMWSLAEREFEWNGFAISRTEMLKFGWHCGDCNDEHIIRVYA